MVGVLVGEVCRAVFVGRHDSNAVGVEIYEGVNGRRCNMIVGRSGEQMQEIPGREVRVAFCLGLEGLVWIS